MQRSIAARNASTPKYRSDSQSFSALDVLDSCTPRSEKLTSSSAG
jgi:hypothetical protein